jgi:hydroxylamine reductase
VTHISDRNFAPVVMRRCARGFLEDGPDDTILTGFGHHAVLSVAPQVSKAVKSGQIRHFFLIAGCDGAHPKRDYYAQLADSIPQHCVVLTLACGKFRFNKHQLGTVAGLPRLMDMGQCNDAYSAIRVALALAGAFDCGVNDLPLSLILSWYEQKAVSILRKPIWPRHWFDATCGNDFPAIQLRTRRTRSVGDKLELTWPVAHDPGL